MMRKNLIELFQLNAISMLRTLLSFIISCALFFQASSQASITKVTNDCIEIKFYNQSVSDRQTINPYFLGNSRLKGKSYVYSLFKYKYRFDHDTLFVYLNDTTIIPGIEKYNDLDSFRIQQGVKKYITLSPQDQFEVKYSFPKVPFTHVVVYYTFNDLSQKANKAEVMVYERKRKKK